MSPGAKRFLKYAGVYFLVYSLGLFIIVELIAYTGHQMVLMQIRERQSLVNVNSANMKDVSFNVAEPFKTHGNLRVAKSGTYLEHTDGTPFFMLADTCWTGPALSSEEDWNKYLEIRKQQGFNAIQFNMVSPWRTAPADLEGRQSYSLQDGKFSINEEFYSKRLDARIQAILAHGLLPVPVLCWANKKGDAGVELKDEQLLELIRFEVERYKDIPALWILAGDNGYKNEDAAKWKRIGQAVFKDHPELLVTTHPTGENWPWKNWEDEKWLDVLGYQSGHGDGDKTLNFIHHGPPAEYGRQQKITRPAINLEPPYEDHLAYQSRKPHSDYNVRRAVYWSLLVTPPAGFTYGGHGVWSWHTKPGTTPTDHGGTGTAKIWSEAVRLPGAVQMGFVRKLFESLKWTELKPNQELIKQAENAPANSFVACASTPDLSQVVIYVPKGAEFVIEKSKINVEKYQLSVFDPATGKTSTQNLNDHKEQDRVIIYNFK